ncbi:hypothetical protein DBR47_18145 [Paucibacter sp. KBW04]|nr:hypothetical protein DBR47_18145 [Paucibacter sp. KBW04]
MSMKSVTEQDPGLSPEIRASLDFVLRAASVLFRQRSGLNDSPSAESHAWANQAEAAVELAEPEPRS